MSEVHWKAADMPSIGSTCPLPINVRTCNGHRYPAETVSGLTADLWRAFTVTAGSWRMPGVDDGNPRGLKLEVGLYILC